MKSKVLLLVIIFLAAILRFYNLGSLPPSLDWDEAAWGYNAYSLGIDGRDEFGRFLPLDYLESFGDFKPPVYAYLDVLPVKILGLNEFSTRFPSALFGTLTVLLTYFLVKEIFTSSKRKELYALFSALFLALSPWSIMLSRAAFEANVSTFFIVFGVYLFFKAINSDRKYLIFSFVSFVVSFYTFNTARIVSPVLLFLLLAIFIKKLLSSKKELLIAIGISIVLILPVTKFMLSSDATLRFREVNIFSDPSVAALVNKEIQNDNGSLLSKIIHNRRFVYSALFLQHYFDNLSPSFLFIKGDGNPKFSTQDVGEMYLWDLPFFIFGIFLLFRKRENHWWILPLWLIIAIIPAATARETPHALRIETTLPTFQVLTAYGFVQVIEKFKKYKTHVLSIFLFILFLNVLYFLHGYLTYYAKEFSGEWQYGYKDSINYVLKNLSKYNQVNISETLGRPYIYYLFYSKEDPRVYRKTAIIKRDANGFVDIGGYGKFRFAKDLGKLRGKGFLFIDSPNRLPAKGYVLKTFYLLNGDPILIAYVI